MNKEDAILIPIDFQRQRPEEHSFDFEIAGPFIGVYALRPSLLLIKELLFFTSHKFFLGINCKETLSALVG